MAKVKIPRGLKIKTFADTVEEGVETAAEYGAKKGAKMRKKQLNRANAVNRAEAISESFKGALKEASQPKVAGDGTNAYFRHNGVEYRRLSTTVTSPNGASGVQNQYASRKGRTGEYTTITGEDFTKARDSYGGTMYASYDDMLLGDGGHAKSIADTAAGDGDGLGLMQFAQNHPYVAMGLAAGGGILAANLLDDDY